VATRETPESWFATRQQVQTQEPVHVMYLQTEPTSTVQFSVDPSLVVLGIVALIGLFAFLAFLKK